MVRANPMVTLQNKTSYENKCMWGVGVNNAYYNTDDDDQEDNTDTFSWMQLTSGCWEGCIWEFDQLKKIAIK